MASSSSCLLLFTTCLFLTETLISFTSAQNSPFLNHVCLYDRGNFTANSTYSINLNNLVSSLPSLTPNDYGFYNFSVDGGGGETVNAVVLCRGDVKPDDCISCMEFAGKELRNRCPTQKEAVIWYDYCMFRYANRSILNRIETSPPYALANGRNLTGDREGLNQALRGLLDRLRGRAAAGGSRKKYAAENATAPSFQTFYGLVQCTPDLSEQFCADCLTLIFAETPNCCDGKVGGRWVTPSCNFRYEIYRFYDPAADPGPTAEPPTSVPIPSTPPPPPPVNETGTSKGKGNDSSKTIISVVVPIVGVIALVACLRMFLMVRKKKAKQKVENSEAADEIISADSLQFDFGTIKAATNNFSSANKLGKGGFGVVYKGTLSDGQEIAVKRLSRNSIQGDVEFKNEVLLVAKLQHRNLVTLQGFCLEGKERLLVYEFVPHSSLDHFIFNPMKRSELDWETRYKIIGGVARGLLYLHEDSRLRIIHRDLKASNILLAEDMTPKIADFGMARLFDIDQTTTQRYTSRIVGTYGYMAPEFAMHGQFSVKTDVFSFGVLVLEIVSGQRNNCFRNGENVEDLLSFAWRNWREGTALNLVDPRMVAGSRNDIMRCIHISLLCGQENVSNRPTMASVVLMLNSSSISLPTPNPPALFVQNNAGSDPSSSTVCNLWAAESSGSLSEVLPLYEIDSSISELYPR